MSEGEKERDKEIHSSQNERRKKDRTGKPKKTGTITESKKRKIKEDKGEKKIQSGKSKKVRLTGQKNKLKPKQSEHTAD